MISREHRFVKYGIYGVLVLLVLPLKLLAFSLGELEVFSHLNEPLNAKISILKMPEEKLESLKIHLATDEAFEKAGIDRIALVEHMVFKIQDEDHHPWIKVTTTESFVEPVLNFLLEIRGSSQVLTREFTAFLDPALPVKKKIPVLASHSEPQSSLSSHRVQSSDRLWILADPLRQEAYEGASRFQVLMALYLKNPQAFIGREMDKLREGFLLHFPTRAEILEHSAQESYEWFLSRSEQPLSTASLKVVVPPQEDPVADPMVPWEDLMNLKTDLELSSEGLALQAEENNLLQQRLDRLEESVQSIQEIQKQFEQQRAREILADSAPLMEPWDSESFLWPQKEALRLMPELRASDVFGKIDSRGITLDRWAILSALTLGGVSFFLVVYLFIKSMRTGRVAHRDATEEKPLEKAKRIRTKSLSQKVKTSFEVNGVTAPTSSSRQFVDDEWSGMDSEVAQLDLARLYIQMREYHRARAMLNPLKQSANQQIQNTAHVLWEEMSQEGVS